MTLRGARIHVGGVVQGVGFRPFVYSLASGLGLTGRVRNTSAGVDIEADGSEELLTEFVRRLRSDAPPLARIDELVFDWAEPNGYADFEIVHSETIPSAFQPISPDVSICPDCLRELFDPSDRRHRYPFINCTNCGPRFTIIQDIPYDRPLTTMAAFSMCPDCAHEYTDPADRRFHAQPVACPACGPRVWLETEGRETAKGGDAIRAARGILRAGAILAVRGLGGFHLACDAANTAAVAELRHRKLRVDKPFALMMPDLATIERHCLIDDQARALLEVPARPIVLLSRRPGSDIAAEVAPGQGTLGVMLPYTPLHYLLLEEEPGFPQALVMTSGNLSEEPIATSNDEARARLAGLADAYLLHDREIHIRCDDSVVRAFEGQVYPLRRSRGYAPFPVRLKASVPPLLATGAELKNAFCVTHGQYAFLSHHIGDLQNYETLRSFEQGIEHFERLFRVEPRAIAHDLHPDYLATRYALGRAGRQNIPAVGVQHHHAHIAACMTEHSLPGDRALIGLAFDGTGYGPDGAIWGGEVLVADLAGYERALHLDYFPLPGGDLAVRQPGRAALALLWSLELDWDDRLAPVQALCAEDRATLRVQLDRRLNTPLTSSMGRLFDAFAALCGLRQTVNYEAQAAMEFEACLDPGESGAYPFALSSDLLDPRPAVEAVIRDVLAGVAVRTISARFHNGLADLCLEACRSIRARAGIGEVALSGGVWQNMALLERVLARLRADGFSVYVHRQVPANDGGLALGQVAVAAWRLQH